MYCSLQRTYPVLPFHHITAVHWRKSHKHCKNFTIYYGVNWRKLVTTVRRSNCNVCRMSLYWNYSRWGYKLPVVCSTCQICASSIEILLHETACKPSHSHWFISHNKVMYTCMRTLADDLGYLFSSVLNARMKPESQCFPTSTLIWCHSLGVNTWMLLISQKIRVHWLWSLRTHDPIFCLDKVPACDGQTDGRICYD